MKRFFAVFAVLATLLVVGLVALTAGSGSVRGQIETPTPPAQCLVPADLDVVIVIDKTGSMITNYSGSPPHTRLYWAKLAAVALVDGMAGGPSSHSLGPHHVEVITFDGSSPVEQVISFSNDADAVRAAITGMGDPPTLTDTYIAPALTLATNDLNAHIHGGSHGSYKVVVLLSDGRNFTDGDPITGTNCPPTHQRRADTENAIPGLHAAADTVYSVGIGSPTCGAFHLPCDPMSCNPNELDTALLTDIAEGPPGNSIIAQDAYTLPDIYGEISQEVVNICVNFSGHKYDDPACDGTAGTNPPLAGINVKLIQGTTVIDQKTTDSGGAYIFVNEQPGTYLVCEDLIATDRVQTSPLLGSGTVAHPPYGICYESTLTTAGGSEGGLDFYNCVPPTPTPTPTATFTPTPTKTSTPTPTPIATHVTGVGGAVRLPPAAISAESGTPSESAGSPFTAYGALAVVVVAGILALCVAGWYRIRRRST